MNLLNVPFEIISLIKRFHGYENVWLCSEITAFDRGMGGGISFFVVLWPPDYRGRGRNSFLWSCDHSITLPKGYTTSKGFRKPVLTPVYSCYIKLLRCNKICLFNKSQPCANNLYLICFLYPYDTWREMLYDKKMSLLVCYNNLWQDTLISDLAAYIE